ncbi:hypothetical protein [Cellulomonas sp. PhB143]|uniref:DUF6069 family protein n=1 Tax=Cellulomonas sp. PhB143 TaxID=2485186 RepID=UPI000FAE24DC|nr:hypothetical protein [Cellulomonas sp. PhB143]ROS73529.1 hypothetical protein EDF32_2377 [Cellulomonas sp. PhB143]
MPAPQQPQDPSGPPVPVVARWRFAAGSLVAVVVTAAAAYVVCLLLESVFAVELAPPPDLLPERPDAQVFAVVGAAIGLGAVVMMALLAASVSRPRLFFGWSMVVVVALLTVAPFTWADGVVTQAFTAALFLVATVVAWACVSGVAIRTIHTPRPPAVRRAGAAPGPA